MKRAKELFYLHGKTKLLVVVGNHDIGYHYDMTERKIERFNKSFRSQFVDLHQPNEIKGVHFLIVNSMALQDDGCSFCNKTQKQLKYLNQTLQCFKYRTDHNLVDFEKYCKLVKNDFNSNTNLYSRPIIFSHIPLNRKGNKMCPQESDSESYIKTIRFKENFDCLSKRSTQQVSYFSRFKLF